MTIRFKCLHCQKALSVKDHLAGKKAACPVCKKTILIPTPVSAPVDVEAFAAEALADQPAAKPVEEVSSKTIDFICPQCDEELKLPADLGGKKTPCPLCKKIIKVPQLEVEKPKDWRTNQKTGPSAAMSNLPEQLADAWGTEQKGKVSLQAMEEAGALPEVEAKPLGVSGWIRRGFKVSLVLGLTVLFVTLATRARDKKREKNAREEAAKLMAQLDPLRQAELYRAFGEIDIRNRKREEARNNFIQARAKLQEVQDKAGAHERDLLLIKVALSQAEMGGTAEEALKGVNARFDWNDDTVPKEIGATLEAIRAPEARAAALRALACLLLDKGKFVIAVGLANNQANADLNNGRIQAQRNSMVLAIKDDEEVAQRMPPPVPGQPIQDTSIRVTYTQRAAFKKDYDEALKIAGADSPLHAAGRLEACVAGAAIALADTKNKDKALPFIQEGQKALEDLLKQSSENKAPVPWWFVLDLVRLGSRTADLPKIKDLVAKLPPALQPRAQVDILQAELDASTTTFNKPIEDVFGKEKSPTRAFAHEALARHNARMGGGNIQSTQEGEEECKAFLLIGIALGEQDRK